MSNKDEFVAEIYTSIIHISDVDSVQQASEGKVLVYCMRGFSR